MITNPYMRRYLEKYPERARERLRRWRKNNPEKLRAQALRAFARMMADPERHKKTLETRRNYSRKHSLIIKGKYTRVNKRPRPDNICELCGLGNTWLHYHHWDDAHPELGLWVCAHCHKIAEGQEKGIVSKYLELKKHLSPAVQGLSRYQS